MTDQLLDLDAIRQRAEAATAGPWRIVEYPSSLEVAAPDRTVTWLTATTAPHHPSMVEIARNAHFIAAARTDIPALIAEVERLREALEAEGRLIESLSKAGADQAELWEEDRGHVGRLRAALEEIAALSNDTKTGYADAIIFARDALEGVQRNTAE